MGEKQTTQLLVHGQQLQTLDMQQQQKRGSSESLPAGGFCMPPIIKKPRKCLEINSCQLDLKSSLKHFKAEPSGFISLSGAGFSSHFYH